MEITDFPAFGLYAVVFAITLLVIRFTLKRLGWKREKHLLLDAVYIWHTWFFSSIAAAILLAIFDSNTGISFELPQLVFAIVVVFFVWGASVAATTLVMWRLIKQKDENGTFLFEAEEEADKARVETSRLSFVETLTMSLITTFAATFALAVMLGVFGIGITVYEHFYPKPEIEFEIYDI